MVAQGLIEGGEVGIARNRLQPIHPHQSLEVGQGPAFFDPTGCGQRIGAVVERRHVVSIDLQAALGRGEGLVHPICTQQGQTVVVEVVRSGGQRDCSLPGRHRCVQVPQAALDPAKLSLPFGVLGVGRYCGEGVPVGVVGPALTDQGCRQQRVGGCVLRIGADQRQ